VPFSGLLTPVRFSCWKAKTSRLFYGSTLLFVGNYSAPLVLWFLLTLLYPALAGWAIVFCTFGANLISKTNHKNIIVQTMAAKLF